MSLDLVRIAVTRRVKGVRLAAEPDAPLAAPPRAEPVPSTPAPPPADFERRLAEARREGEARGREAASRELALLTSRLGVAMTEARARAQDELRDLEATLAGVAVAIAEKVLEQEIAARRYDLGATIERVLAVVRERSEAIVHVNPADLAVLEAQPTPGYRCAADASVERGDFVIETPLGRIVRSVREQLGALRDAVRDGEVVS